MGHRGCLGHQPSPVPCLRFHAGQRPCTLPADGVGPAGAPPARGLWDQLQVGVRVHVLRGGVPAAVLKSQRPDDLVRRVQRRRSGTLFAWRPGLRHCCVTVPESRDGVRTSCGFPVAARFVARAVGVVGCCWESMTLAPHTPLAPYTLAGCSRALLPGPRGVLCICAGRPEGEWCARGDPVLSPLGGASGVRRSPSSGRSFVGRAARPYCPRMRPVFGVAWVVASRGGGAPPLRGASSDRRFPAPCGCPSPRRGWCGPGHPKLAPQHALLQAGLARRGGGGRASPGGAASRRRGERLSLGAHPLPAALPESGWSGSAARLLCRQPHCPVAPLA